MKRKLGPAVALGLAVLVSSMFHGSASASCDIPVLPSDGSTSVNARAPSLRYRYARAVYLMTAGEAQAAGLTAGTTPTGIGWSYDFRPGVTGTGGLVVYLQNTSNTTNTKSTDWATAIGGMTLVHNAQTQLPDVFGEFTIPFSGGSPFTYTGGAVYVAFDWQYLAAAMSTSAIIECNTQLTNGLLGAQSAVGPQATLAASNFRPATSLSSTVPHNNAGVDYVISLGAVPATLIGNPVQNFQATITNYGDVPISVPVTLNVTGAESFTDTRTTVTMAGCGGFDTVTFSDFTPSVIGHDTITVTVPSDDVTQNDIRSKPFDNTFNQYSYKHAGTSPDGGVGFTNGTGEFLARFTISQATNMDAVTLEFFLPTGQPTGTAYRLVVRADDGNGVPGAILYQDGADRTVTSAGPVVVRPLVPIPVPAGNFFVGIRQTNTTNANYSFDYEDPIRPGLFWYSTTPDIGPWFDFQNAGLPFQLNIGVNLVSCFAPPAVDVSPNDPARCAPGGIPLAATVTGGTGPFTYQWTQDGVDVAGATGPQYTPVKASAGLFFYNCKVTDSAGCVNVQDGTSTKATWLANGSVCDDGNGCTVSDICASGNCSGTPIVAPSEVTGLSIQPDKHTLMWNSAGPAGPGTVHDVPRGLVSQLPVGSGAGESCLATTPNATTTDGALPGAGAAFWYLVRGRNSCGTGTYGTASNASPRITTVCP